MTSSARELVGYLNVDAGIVMVGDPCYTLPDGAPFRDEAARNWDTFVSRVFGKGQMTTCTPFGEGIAIVVGSGKGDGRYPVEVEYDSTGNLSRLTVTFVD